MDFMIMMPLGPQLMRLFNIQPSQFSLIVSSYTFSAFVSGLFSSLFIDRFDRKNFLLILFTGFIIGTLLCGLAPTYEFLLAARIFTGLFGGVLGALILSITGDVIPLERRGQAMGMIMAAFSVASVFGVPFGLFMASHTSFGWHAPFLFLALLGTPIIFMVYRFLPHQNKHLLTGEPALSPFRVIVEIMRERNHRRALLLSMCMMLGHFSIIPFLSPYMVANVGFGEDQLQYIYLVGGACTVFSSPMIGKMADRYGKLKVFMLFAFLCNLPVFAITNMPPVPVYIVLVVAGIFFVMSGGRMIPMQAMITAAVSNRMRGSFMSINSSLMQLMAGIGSYLGGLIIVKMPDASLENYEYVGYISIVMSLTAMFLARGLRTAEGEKF